MGWNEMKSHGSNNEKCFSVLCKKKLLVFISRQPNPSLCYALHSLLSLWIPIFHNETISSNRFNSSFRLVKVFQFIGKCARYFFSFLSVREIVEENSLNCSVVLSRTNFTWCEIHFIQKLWRLCNRMWRRSERKVAKFLLYSIFFCSCCVHWKMI